MTVVAPKINGFSDRILEENKSLFRSIGTISKVVGLTLESTGPLCAVGDLVVVKSAFDDQRHFFAEVVGFRDSSVLLFPLEGVDGIRCGDEVHLVNEGFKIPVGIEMLGRIVDGLGRPLDNKGSLKTKKRWKVKREAPNSMMRPRINKVFKTGVRAIDALNTCGVGQRIGIFAGSGVGKSSLMGMICRNAESDINVIALVGERGKEVVEFIEDSLGEEGLKKSIVFVATSDKSALQRVKCAESAMATAEYFRDCGRNVTLVMDSVTRLAMAQREIGLAAGEPPATRGYPPSVFAMLPSLLERAGRNENGSITAFLTVLIEGDDINDPIGDTVRGILDGHLMLSRDLASKAHWPAIDILNSISRVMNGIVSDEHTSMAQMMRKLMSIYRDAEDMINIGAYKSGINTEIDLAVEKKQNFDSLLQQGLDENIAFESTLTMLREALN